MGRQNFLVFMAAMGGLLISSLNQLVLKHSCGSAELGGYAAAWTIVSLGVALLSQVSRIGKPAIARITIEGTKKSERMSFLFKYIFIIFMVAASVGIPVFFFPELILKIFFSPDYISSAGIMKIMGIYILVYSIAIISAQYVVAVRMERLYFFNVICGGCLSIILCYILIPKYSGLGAAFALLIAHGVTAGFNAIGMIKHLRGC